VALGKLLTPVCLCY